MYWGKENQTIHHTGKKSHESQNQALQRQVETYTRRFEEEKRRLFRVQQNHREVLKSYETRVDELEMLKAKKYRSEVVYLNGRIKQLEFDLEKGITSYNDSLSKNNSLKNEIDELRKHRKNQIQTIRKVKKNVEERSALISESEKDIDEKKVQLQKFKHSILSIKQFNEQQASTCRENIDNMQKRSDIQDKMKQTMKNVAGKGSAETSDSQPIVKLRLKNLIHRNKERIRVGEQYKKNMEMIARSFEEIKKESGINSLEEVTKTFLKQEEQNTFIFEYIGKLTNDLEKVKDENEIIKQKIGKEENKNDNYRTLLNGTPESKKREIQLKKYFTQKNQPIDKFNQFLSNIKPFLFHLLQIGKQNDLTYLTYQQRLSELESLIDEEWEKEKVEERWQGRKEEITKYSKMAPIVNQEEIKQKNEEWILEEGKLQQYACEFWEKKKISK